MAENTSLPDKEETVQEGTRLHGEPKASNSFEKKKKGSSVFAGKVFPVFCRVALCLFAAFFLSYAIIVITSTEEYTSSFYERNDYIAFDEEIADVENEAEWHYNRLYGVAEKLEFAETEDAVLSVLQGEYRNLMYMRRGAAYYASGAAMTEENDGYTELMALSNAGVPACSEPYYMSREKEDHMLFFIPVRGSSYVDGIAAYYKVKNIIELDNIRSSSASALIIIDSAGKVVSESCADDCGFTVGDDLRTFVNSLAIGEGPIDDVVEILSDGEKGSFTLQSNTVGYTFSLSPISNYGDNLWLVRVSVNNSDMSPELSYIKQVVALCIVAMLAFGIIILYVLIRYKKRTISDTPHASADTPDGCPGSEVFRINATKLLQNKGRKYALSVLEIRQFRYLGENISEKDMRDLLDYIAKVISALCNVRESYGYLGDGKFGLLIYVESDRSVKDRVRLIESVASKNALMGASKSKRKFNIGISMTQDGGKQSFGELLGYANIACEKAKNNINVPYVIFNEQINSERMHNEKIEAEMETALATGEFRLFLQPKYNIAADRIDSAEALVRWFDTKTGEYRFPGEFIGLFESNGFITKLDHFMYIETLKFLSSAAERFDKVVPISVNVSMVTVSDPGFLDFYIENKNKYRVGDNFITIEFTESFAMEDYQKIRTIVDTLHQNGIRCSLDDFGSGYSSLGTLKNIPFDELKFDRLFLSRGYNKQNDDAMLETLFELARSMGIKVVQEGVETREMFDSVVSKGCDVIQGYYYAKAIPVEEYRLFINSNTSIKYKSRVK